MLSSCDLTSSGSQSGNLLWRSPISNGSLTDGEIANVLQQNIVVTLGNSSGKRTLFAFDKESGKQLWTWADWFITDRYSLVDHVYIHNNIMVVSNRGTNYGININNGTTLWSMDSPDRNTGSLGATGIGNWFFFSLKANINSLIKAQIQTGKETNLIVYPKSNGAFFATPIVASNQDTMLTVTSVYGEAATNFYNKTYLTLFNVTQNKEVYTLLQREGPSTENNLPMGVPVVQGDRVFTAIGFGVQCNEIATGKLLWRTTTPRPFTEGGVILGDNILFANDDDGFLQAFEPETGKVLWKTKTAGSVTGLFFMNGVVYLIGGDGNLYAIDGKQGTIIWKMPSPDDDKRSGSFFTGKVVGANGKIYARSFLNLYCYKAAR
ncbi:MAG: PQQ-binding-like beta-propeller repeat protein [Ignavibacteria bacterium]|nr:PQQ-binding-like beta-propeller repeat protein [Ignavibacteria bacterium]